MMHCHMITLFMLILFSLNHHKVLLKHLGWPMAWTMLGYWDYRGSQTSGAISKHLLPGWRPPEERQRDLFLSGMFALDEQQRWSVSQVGRSVFDRWWTRPAQVPLNQEDPEKSWLVILRSSTHRLGWATTGRCSMWTISKWYRYRGSDFLWLQHPAQPHRDAWRWRCCPPVYVPASACGVGLPKSPKLETFLPFVGLIQRQLIT